MVKLILSAFSLNLNSYYGVSGIYMTNNFVDDNYSGVEKKKCKKGLTLFK